MKGNSQTIHDSIRVEAFLLSEKAGHPSGMAHYFWTQAEAIVRTRATAVSVAVKPAAKRTVKSKAVVTDKPTSKLKAKAKATAPKTEAKTVKAAKPKTAANASNGKTQQLSLDGELSAPAPRRASRK